jgi:lysophospholipase L1-like esterase
MSARLALLPLAPLLLMQALHVRRVTPRLPEPGGERGGRCGTGPPLRLLILGDSAAAGVGAAHQDEALAGRLAHALAPHFALEWRLLAQTGDRSADALRRLEAEPELRCDVVLTSLGVNDVTALATPAAFVAEQRRLVQCLRARGARRLLLSGLPPMHDFPALPQPLRWALGGQARRFDAMLAAWIATQSDCEHLPFGDLPDAAMMASDGFHPGPPIYARWAEAVAQRVVEVFATHPPATATASAK